MSGGGRRPCPATGVSAEQACAAGARRACARSGGARLLLPVGVAFLASGLAFGTFGTARRSLEAAEPAVAQVPGTPQAGGTLVQDGHTQERIVLDQDVQRWAVG